MSAVAEVVFDIKRHLVGHLVTHARWKPLMNLLFTMRRQGAGLRGLGGSLLAPFVPGRFANWYLHARGLDFPARIPNWVDPRKVNTYRGDLLPRGRDRWTKLQLGPFLEGASLTLEADDVCASLCGVDVRRPFADVDVCEFFLSLPAEVKFPDMKSKTMMRRILQGKLPDEILKRRDKTFFNDYFMSKIDYATARQFLVNPSFRIQGVDYVVLADLIERKDFKLIDYLWVNDLVRIHAFLSQW